MHLCVSGRASRPPPCAQKPAGIVVMDSGMGRKLAQPAAVPRVGTGRFGSLRTSRRERHDGRQREQAAGSEKDHRSPEVKRQGTKVGVAETLGKLPSPNLTASRSCPQQTLSAWWSELMRGNRLHWLSGSWRTSSIMQWRSHANERFETWSVFVNSSRASASERVSTRATSVAKHERRPRANASCIRI